MKIATVAWRFVLPLTLAGALGLLLMKDPANYLSGIFLAGVGFTLSVFTLYFFRDPERPLPEQNEKIYSPGDGVVLSVAREGPGDVVTARIFLSIFNVHVQRVPYSGRVAKVQTVAGSFKAAMKDDARSNARVVMTIKPEGKNPLIVEQIAGLIARRIECWPKVDQEVKVGQRYGIIYFGSQVAVHFPAGSTCSAVVGQKVRAGLSEIGQWTSNS